MEDDTHATALAEHLCTLCEFHRDDDADQQHADAIETIDPAEDGRFHLTLGSGRRFRVTVTPA